MGHLLKHIFILLTISTTLLSATLQYTHTHETTQHEDCPSAHHDHTADTCSLCWFMVHQVVDGLQVPTNVISPFEQTIDILHIPERSSFVLLYNVYSRSNRGPPILQS